MSIQYETDQSTTTQSAFDIWASKYDQEHLRWFVSILLDHAIVKAIPDGQPHPQCILDIGCGTGRSLIYMGKCFPQARLAGVDPSQGMIDVASRKMALFSQCEFRIANALHTTFPDSTFDLAFSTISFHYWSEPVKSLEEIRRTVRPGGFFLLADGFVATDFLGALPSLYFKHIRPDAQIYSAETIHKMFTEARWRVLRQKRVWTLGGGFLITVGEKV